jgi:hypothetical protein
VETRTGSAGLAFKQKFAAVVLDSPAVAALQTAARTEFSVAVCKSCGEEVEELLAVAAGGRTKKLCEDCAERLREEKEIAEASESAVQSMMDFKGRR